MMSKITFVTGNQNRADLMAKYLEAEVEHIKLDLPEIQSLDITEVVTHKVKSAFEQVKKPVMIEDTFVAFHALGRLPGPFIKFFMQELTNAGMCQLMQGYADKSATASVNFGYYDGKTVKIFSEELKGTIADKPQGSRGMGWDPIFIPEGYQQTRAEMSEEDYKKTSPRYSAIQKIKEYIHHED